MSTLDLDDKVLVGLVAGTIALVALVNAFGRDEAKAGTPTVVETTRSIQVAAVQEQPYYAFTYTYKRPSADCLGETIAAANIDRCYAELNPAPVREEVRLRAPATTYAAVPATNATR
jgi:hypothetical protein